MELSDIISRIVQEYGKDVIAEKRFVYMISDYYSFRDNPAKKRVLTVLVNDGYTARLLNQSESHDISIITNQIIEDVCKNYGFREELVRGVITSHLHGMGFSCPCNSNKPNSAEEISIRVGNNIDDSSYVEPLFYLRRTSIWKKKETLLCDAIGHYGNGTFVIHKGSLLSVHTPNSRAYVIDDGGELKIKYMKMPTSISESFLKRKEILHQHCKLQQPRYYYVETDIVCASPSEAAFIVVGGDANGLNVWKDKEGKSLNQYCRAKKVP